MNLPFTPSFFKELEIYQQLQSYEKEEKLIWEAEKIVLLWAISEGHRDIGEYIKPKNIKEVLGQALGTGIFKSGSKMDYVVTKHKQVLNALAVRNLGDRDVNENLRFNQNGFIAGKILKETNNLEFVYKYEIWRVIWWIVFVSAVIILLDQSILAVISLCEKLSNLIGFS